LYINVSSLLSLKLDVAEKGTLGPIGVEKFRVGLVALSHQDEGKRRDGLIGNRVDCEFVAPVVLTTIAKVVVVFPTQASLVILFGILLSRHWNNASENPTSIKIYKDLIAEGAVLIWDTGTALLICVD
jgi:hypothetical protein